MNTEPASERLIDCSTHGRQGMGLVCMHIAHAIDTDEKVGFHWSANTDLARSDAWCSTCEARLLAEDWSEAWFTDADFKLLCASCWDLASHQLDGVPSCSPQS